MFMEELNLFLALPRKDRLRICSELLFAFCKVLLPALLGAMLFGGMAHGAEECARVGEIMTPDGGLIRLRLALTSKELFRGLSGVKDEDFKSNEAMLFVHRQDAKRFVVARETHFDIGVFFLDKDLMVVGLDRKLPAHPSVSSLFPLPASNKFFSRHTLEMRADSPLAQKIKMGTRLSWNSKPSLSQISDCIF